MDFVRLRRLSKHPDQITGHRDYGHPACNCRYAPTMSPAWTSLVSRTSTQRMGRMSFRECPCEWPASEHKCEKAVRVITSLYQVLKAHEFVRQWVGHQIRLAKPNSAAKSS